MIKLSNRLKACASLVYDGSRLADIGCDHGFVPVYLVKSGKIPSAVASDINEKPLMSCRELVEIEGLGDKIKCVLSNGLENIDENEIDDILIAGMGGELIADILEACDFSSKKHIILNPMTHSEIARKWLFENGFEIKNDLITADGRHHYNVLDAVYTGEIQPYNSIKLFLGNIEDFSDREYFLHLLSYLENKGKSGIDYSDVISEIKERLNDDG